MFYYVKIFVIASPNALEQTWNNISLHGTRVSVSPSFYQVLTTLENTGGRGTRRRRSNKTSEHCLRSWSHCTWNSTLTSENVWRKNTARTCSQRRGTSRRIYLVRQTYFCAFQNFIFRRSFLWCLHSAWILKNFLQKNCKKKFSGKKQG